MEKRQIVIKRRRLIERSNELLRDIEIDFKTAAHWNNSVLKLGEAPIDYDPDGQIKKMAAGIAEMICRESAHKIPRFLWLSEIKRVAIEKYQYTQYGANHTDWEQYAHDYYLDCTPEEALQKHRSNAK